MCYADYFLYYQIHRQMLTQDEGQREQRMEGYLFIDGAVVVGGRDVIVL